MNDLVAHPPAQAFFLDATPGQRFCMYYSVAVDTKIQGAIIYIHPFADEMNMSRRMAALQAKQFAAKGFAVLQIDLLGCGDSSGEFGDARWDIWKEDIALAKKLVVGTPCSTNRFVGIAPRCFSGIGLCQACR
jgi:exosortase A-associated hydrolase 2